MKVDVDTDGLRILAEAATPGPWEVSDYAGLRIAAGRQRLRRGERADVWVAELDQVERDDCEYGSPDYSKSAHADAAFIAAANPEVVLALIEEIERLRAEAT